jgi:tagatose 6-phosphate kinase
VILAAGLTPAWQQILTLDELHVGEVNRAAESVWCSSGKVLNVGIALRLLGGPMRVLSTRGGRTGEMIAEEMNALGVPCRWVPIERATRICTTVLDRSSGRTTELVENGGPIRPDEVAGFAAAFEEVAPSAWAAVLTGSLPAGAPTTLFRDLASLLQCPAVLDIRGPELLEALPLRPLLVKPNREELGRTVDRELSTDADLRGAMEEMRGLGAQWVVVSQGKDTLWALGPRGLRTFRPPLVEVINPIGCGDCLAAGIAWGVGQGLEVEEALRIGMGAAAQNASMLLPSRLEIETVHRLAAQVAEERG